MLGLASVTDLPSEVVSVLPADPYAQLELANKIINFAYSQKVASIEQESQQLRETVIAKQGVIKTLERRVSHLEQEIQDLQAKHKAAVEDSHKLATEKGALIETVKKLNREIAKLEGFKRNLLQHLHEDDEPAQMDRSMAAVDMSSERLVADVLNSAYKHAPSMGGGGSHNNLSSSASFPTGMYKSAPSVSATPAFSNRPSTAMPYSTSGGGGGGSPPRQYNMSTGSGGGFQGLGNIPTNGHQSPTHQSDRQPPAPHPYATTQSSSSYAQQHQQQGQQQYYQPPSQGPQRRESPPATAPSAPMDGKEFFRQARARLSYEAFSQFLQAIKDLNAGRLSKEDTMRCVQDLCGPQHADLFAMFETLLSKHMPGSQF